MLIGQDFPKIEFELFGLDLLEPNCFIGNVVIVFVSFYYFFKVRKQKISCPSEFLRNWKLLYLSFGISFLFGGFGHLIYNYTGYIGKSPSWFVALLSPYFIERAMISIFPNRHKRRLFRRIALAKLIFFTLVEIAVLVFLDISKTPEIGLLPPTLSTTLGLLICLGVLGAYYQAIFHNSFKYLWYAAVVLLLSGIPQALKINIHPLFDRNDLSHVFLLVSLVIYYQTLKKYEDFKGMFPKE
jgi:hypothetical protein